MTNTDAAIDPTALADRALASATMDCQVLVSVQSTANVRWAANTLTTNGLTSGHEVTVISIKDGRQVGAVTRSGVTADHVGDLVAEAEAAAAQSTPAEDAGPLATGQDSGPFPAVPAEVSASSLALLADRLAEAIDLAKSADQELFGFAEQTEATTYLATSTGIRVSHTQPAAVVQLNGKAAARTRSAWAGSAGLTLDAIDVLALNSEVMTRLGWQERQLELAAGRHPVILPPSAVADLMAYAYWSADARSAHEGRSVFGRPGGTRVGDQLTELDLTLLSDPALPGLVCSTSSMTTTSNEMASVFDNGLPASRTAWIDHGRLTALPSTRHSATLAELPHTPYVDNLQLSVAGATGSTMELVGDLDDGLLLTCLWYIREVDPQTLLLTGLTRDGVYRVQGGEVVGAVTNFRFNESPVDLLARMTSVGETTATLGREFGDYFPRVEMPPVRVDDFNFSSVSQAS